MFDIYINTKTIRNLSVMMLASMLFFSCKKDQTELADNSLAIKMSNELIAAINTNELASDEVLNYFTKGNPIVTNKDVSLTVEGKKLYLKQIKSLL